MSPGLQTGQFDTGLFVFLCLEAKLGSFCGSRLLMLTPHSALLMYIHLALETVIIFCHICLSPIGSRDHVANVGNKQQAGRTINCVSIPGRDEAFSVLKNVQAFSRAHPVTSPVGIKVSFSARKTWNHLSSRAWSRSVQRDNINFTYCGQTVSVYRNFSNLICSHEFDLNCM